MNDEEYNQQHGGGIVLSPDSVEVAEDYRQVDKSANSTPSLNLLNFLNFLSYVANILVTYLVGNAGLNGLPSNADQSLKYQTLVTPIGWTFSIWAVIFVFQGIWAVLQLFPKFRAHPYVQKGVSYWYIGVCTTQIVWAFVFAYDLIWVSLLFISLIALTLAGCVVGSYYQYTNANKTLIEFWFLLFPFSIHFGWLLCATLVNANVVVVWAKANAVTQITVAICSLALLHACGVWALFVPSRPNYTVPSVISWATLGVYFRLNDPVNSISQAFDTRLKLASIRCSSQVEPGDFTSDLTNRLRALYAQ